MTLSIVRGSAFYEIHINGQYAYDSVWPRHQLGYPLTETLWGAKWKLRKYKKLRATGKLNRPGGVVYSEEI